MCEVVHTRATCTQLLHDCYDCYRLKRGPPDKGRLAMGPDGRGSYCYGHVNCNDAINRPHDLTNEAIAIRATIECAG